MASHKECAARVKVFMVDDNPDVRASVDALCDSVNIAFSGFSSAEEFLNDYDPSQPGCLVLDLRMRGMDGMQLQSELAERGIHIPIVFVSGYAEVEVAVEAMRAGAVDFLKKPCSNQRLLASIRDAIARDLARREEACDREDILQKLSSLTNREHEVLDLLVKGRNGKSIALGLGISNKTVDTHRANILQKMNASSQYDLIVQTLKVRQK